MASALVRDDRDGRPTAAPAALSTSRATADKCSGGTPVPPGPLAHQAARSAAPGGRSGGETPASSITLSATNHVSQPDPPRGPVLRLLRRAGPVDRPGRHPPPRAGPPVHRRPG